MFFSLMSSSKTWKLIYDLSGTEIIKPSLALLFALHYFKWSPPYVIDAPLDFESPPTLNESIKVN